MLDAEIKESPGFRESLLKAGRAFVTYRLPGTAEQILMSGTVTAEKTSNGRRFTGKPGFLMAGYSTGTPSLWLEPDYYARYTASTTCRSTKLPDSTIPLPETSIAAVSEQEYLTQVGQITGLLRTGKAAKVVLSRTMTAPFHNPLLAPSVFDSLCANHPDAFVYLVFFPHYGLWLGATPEKLLSYNDQHISTMALAGTRPAGTAGEWGTKDKNEHAYVADFIEARLSEAGCGSIVRSAAFTASAGHAEHLRTDFTALCNLSGLAGLTDALHPTPAVCGWPVGEAMDIIHQTEKHDRSYYTGYLGPVGNGTADLFVNLRCMQIVENHAIIYVGGGLTALSDPQSEWDETVLKSTTMLSAIEKMQNLADS